MGILAETWCSILGSIRGISDTGIGIWKLLFLISKSIYIFIRSAHNTNLHAHKKKVPHSISRATLIKNSNQGSFS